MFLKVLLCFPLAVAISTVLANPTTGNSPDAGSNPGLNNFWNPSSAWTNWFYGWGPTVNSWSPFGGWNNWQAPKSPKWNQDGGFRNPWYNQWWHPCSNCHNCTARTVCSRFGFIQQNCSDPNFPYCNFGECSATPQSWCSSS